MPFDIEEICYSIPHGELLKAKEECIQLSGTVNFINSTGVSVDPFFLNYFGIIFTNQMLEEYHLLQKHGMC